MGLCHTTGSDHRILDQLHSRCYTELVRSNAVSKINTQATDVVEQKQSSNRWPNGYKLRRLKGTKKFISSSWEKVEQPRRRQNEPLRGPKVLCFALFDRLNKIPSFCHGMFDKLHSSTGTELGRSNEVSKINIQTTIVVEQKESSNWWPNVYKLKRSTGSKNFISSSWKKVQWCWQYEPIIEEKGRDLTRSYDKIPYSQKKIQKATWQHKNATKNFENTTIGDRLRTVSSVNDSHQTGVSKPVYGIPTFPLTAKAV